MRHAINCKYMYIPSMLCHLIHRWMGPWALRLTCLSAVGLLAGCAHSPKPAPPRAVASDASAPKWMRLDPGDWPEVKFPGKAATQYRSVMNSGQAWVRADAQRSASMLSRSLDLDVHQHPTIQFEWWIEQGLPEADVALRDKEDSPARLILAFDGDRSEFSAKDAALSEWSQLMTGEPLPYATLMYVWCPKRPVGTVVHNPRTDRIRKMVVATPDTLGAVQIERDIVADYTQAFGRAPGRLIGIAIMTDSDNTRSRARTLYGPIHIR